MTIPDPTGASFNILVIGQSGRLQYEAILFAASLRAANADFGGKLFIGEPQPGPLWAQDPRITDPATRALLTELGAEFLPFHNTVFGQTYPYGNKIEALLALPQGEPFLFFDTDTLITGRLADVPFDFNRPSASLRREGTWPHIDLYGPGYGDIWKSLYDRFGLDYGSSLDPTHPDEYWQRYLYFNAGWFFYRCPRQFGTRLLAYAREINDNPPAELVCQPLNPWLDQVALPLVIHSFGGGRHTIPDGLLDGRISCHYRFLPLLYARESDLVVQVLEDVAGKNSLKKVLKAYEPIKRLVYQARGAKVRALFDRADLPKREHVIRNAIKREGLWVR